MCGGVNDNNKDLRKLVLKSDALVYNVSLQYLK